MKKRYIILISIAVILISLLFFLSTIIQYYINSHSKAYIGRRVSIKELHLNYFRTSAQIKDFRMYEATDTDTFASFSELYINFDPWALLTNEYAFSEIRLASPRVNVITDGNHFNFDDLLAAEDSIPAEAEDTTATNFRFTIRNIKLSDGFVSYNDQKVENQLDLRNLNLNIPLIAWDSRQSDVGITFKIGSKGDVTLSANVDNINRKYTLNISTSDVDLGMITNYLKDYLAIDSLKGYLTSNISMLGQMDEVTNIHIKGFACIDSIKMTDLAASPIISADQVCANFKDLDLAKSHFDISSITMSNGHLLAEINKDKTNIEKFLQPYFTADSLAQLHVDTTLISETTAVTYKIDTLKLINASLTLRDNTLNRPFQYELQAINVSMDGLTESSPAIPIVFDMGLNGQGKLNGKYVLNMLNPMDINTTMSISRMDVTPFSPYSEYFIASPVLEGEINYQLGLTMTEKSLNNTNNIRINDLKFGKRTKDSTAVKAPVRLALYILKDKDDKIEFDIPVTGNPSDPQFSLKKIIWKTIGNFFEKVALEPFSAMSSIVGANPANIDKIVYSMDNDTLSLDNQKTVKQIAELIRLKPDLKFNFIQYANPEAEKESIAIRLAKEQFIKSKAPELDSISLIATAAKLSIKNNEFESYIATSVPNSAANTIQKNCMILIGDAQLEQVLNNNITNRNNSLAASLTTIEQLKPESFSIKTADLKNSAEDMKTPIFKIKVELSNH